MRRQMSVAVATVLLAALAAACSGGNSGGDPGKPSAEAPKDDNLNTSGFPIVKNAITLKLMGQKAPSQGAWEQLHFFTEMEKLTNIRFTFDTPDASGFQEKKNLAFASGQLPDVFFGASLTVSEEVNYGGQGILIPLEKLIDQYAPNLKAQLEANPDVKRSITTVDGHIYSLPSIGADNFGRYTRIWINEEWLNKVGLKMPTTTDEFYQVLKAFKEKDPNGNGKADEIPITSIKLGDIRPGILAAFGLTPNPNTNDNMNVGEDGKVFFAASTDAYKKYLEFLAKLYKEKLLDQETFTQTSQQLIAKGKENVLGVFSYAGGFLVVGPEASKHYPHMMPLTSPQSSKPIWPRNASMSRGTFAITSANKYPQATMRWVDYMYAKEGELLIGPGIKDVDWKHTEDGGIVDIRPQGVISEEYRAAKITPSAGTTVPRGAITAPLFTIGQEKNAPNNFFIQTQVNKMLVPYARDVYPYVYFTDDEQKKINNLQTDLKTYVAQMEAKFITGDTPLDKWDEYVSTIKKMKVDELVQIYQAAYDRWKKAK